MSVWAWVAVYGCAAALLFTGIIIGRFWPWEDKAERARRAAVEDALTVRGRHARAWPRNLGTGELAALYERPYPEMTP